MLGDASAALGIIHRRGLGRTRHIDTGLLWIQQTAAEKRLAYSKVLGTVNPADLMTKYLSAEVNSQHCARLGVRFTTGRADSAPTLSHISEGRAIWELDATALAGNARQNDENISSDDATGEQMEARSQG